MLKNSAIINLIKRYDFSFFGLSFIIFAIGMANLHSATHASGGSSNYFKSQLIWYGLSLIVGFVVSFIRPKTLMRLSYTAYIGLIIMLVLVLLIGDIGMGARRWIVLGPIRVQPSELMKIGAAMAYARWFSKNSPDNEIGLKELGIPFALAFLPTVLIAMQPDLGTGLITILIFCIVAFYRKIKWKTLITLIITAVLAGGVMFKFGLKQYQKNRVLTFIDPGRDPLGSGYNAIQSKISIGSGQLTGKGYMESTQASLNYLPENHTDFVFSIFNEEFGFLGACVLLLLYLVFLYRFIRLSSTVTRMYDSILVIGLMAVIFWHTFINMGMVMGLMPIVGLPLPYMSYGGTSLISFGIICGIATSISNDRKLF